MSPRQTVASRLQRFVDAYGKAQSETELLIERAVFGDNLGIRGYTTVAQADALAERLALGPGVRLLDIGAGRGWPGLYLARSSGCDIVLTDVPVEGLRQAASRAAALDLTGRCRLARASGTALPFRVRAFDAIVHADSL